MIRHVAVVRTDVSEELSASIIRVTRIRELGTLPVTATEARCEKILLQASRGSKLSYESWLYGYDPEIVAIEEPPGKT
jgi:hypothetical protein